MFKNNNKIDKETSDYIKQSIERSINKHIEKIRELDNYKLTKKEPPKSLESSNSNNPLFIPLIIPFVSLFSFLAGYYCKRIHGS